MLTASTILSFCAIAILITCAIAILAVVRLSVLVAEGDREHSEQLRRLEDEMYNLNRELQQLRVRMNFDAMSKKYG